MTAFEDLMNMNNRNIQPEIRLPELKTIKKTEKIERTDSMDKFKTWLIFILFGFLIIGGLFFYGSYEGYFKSTLNSTNQCGAVTCTNVTCQNICPSFPDIKMPSYNFTCPQVNVHCTNSS
jgi:hypothetical protein